MVGIGFPGTSSPRRGPCVPRTTPAKTRVVRRGPDQAGGVGGQLWPPGTGAEGGVETSSNLLRDPQNESDRPAMTGVDGRCRTSGSHVVANAVGGSGHGSHVPCSNEDLSSSNVHVDLG